MSILELIVCFPWKAEDRKSEPYLSCPGAEDCGAILKGAATSARDWIFWLARIMLCCPLFGQPAEGKQGQTSAGAHHLCCPSKSIRIKYQSSSSSTRNRWVCAEELAEVIHSTNQLETLRVYYLCRDWVRAIVISTYICLLLLPQSSPHDNLKAETKQLNDLRNFHV